MGKIVQKLIRWMPLVLLFLFFMVDRENSFHVVGFISLLFIYATILIMRVLYAKERWHEEFDSGELGQNASIQKMSDLREKLEEQDGIDSES
ncbi:MAG: hypothetical protein NZ771_08835 [Candidatus Marinimicrobia bacterium]|jgi:hypothetical protein|nr:hypothetical protein [Candidatus Neomarinimicrobiota bacterium]|tara:strand:+ start:309 stop:584 length:276 start_codon:yes stop_codon:yes gene_type:complete